MLLNYEEIKEKNIFQKDSYCDDNFKDANYDLRIGDFISIGEDKPMNPDGSIDLKPRGMIVAVTEEIFNTRRTLVPSATPIFFIRLLYEEKLPTSIRI